MALQACNARGPVLESISDFVALSQSPAPAGRNRFISCSSNGVPSVQCHPRLFLAVANLGAEIDIGSLGSFAAESERDGAGGG